MSARSEPVEVFGTYSCTPICQVILNVEGVTAAIGPAGDNVYVPMRIVGGSVRGSGSPKEVICGTDFAVMFADEKLVHDGNFVVADPAGDILVWYDGSSQATEGAYDEILDGRLPGKIPTRLSVRSMSTGPDWKLLNRRPLLGVGSFDGRDGTLEFTVLSVAEGDGRNEARPARETEDCRFTALSESSYGQRCDAILKEL
jgi:hypothetical protein